MTKPTMKELVPKFLDYIVYEQTMALRTARKYKDCLKWTLVHLPHVVFPEQLAVEDITALKKLMIERHSGASHVNSVVFALRKFLSYCQDELKLETISPKDLRPMKVPKREVEFLRPEEITQLLKFIDTKGIRGLRMRTLIEVLLSTGMRISEALSLNRTDIDWDKKEAVIIGKGNKQRTIYFSHRSLGWIKKYLDRRKDTNIALFVAFGSTRRLTQYDLPKMFKYYTTLAGLKKKVTPHILRHTMATLLLHNGCDITFIKELLGHSEIETTARYYLGTDKQAVKAAHNKFLRF